MMGQKGTLSGDVARYSLCSRLIALGLAVLIVSGLSASAWTLPAHAASDESGVVGATTAANPSVMASAPRSMIFSDDFEAYGDSSLWNLAEPFRVQSDVVANGLFAARLTNDGGIPTYGRKSLNRSYARVFVRIRFQSFTSVSESTTLLQLRPSASRSVVSVQLQPCDQIGYVTGATGITSTGATNVAPGKWHELQIFVDTTATAQEHNVRIWLDQAELTSMRQSAYLGTDGIRMLDLGDNSAGQHSDIAYDDIAVDDAFIPSTQATDPVPGILKIHSIPNRAGVVFELDGQRFVSDSNGDVEIAVARWSTDLRSRITILDDHHSDGSISTFIGWQQWRSPHSKLVYATFRISEPITFSFVDMSGTVVDNSMIGSLILKSKAGDIVTISGKDLPGATLPTSTVISTPAGLSVRSTEYMVDQVFIGGANVVHRAQQRNTFEKSRHWTISLLFYGVTFRATDAFFGSPIGKSISIQSADGSRQYLALDQNGEVVIPRLPRGEFSVSVMGGGYAPPRPIMVSRSQVVDMKVISKLDVLILLSVIGSAVLGLILIGRPFLVMRPVRMLWHGGAAVRLHVTRGMSR